MVKTNKNPIHSLHENRNPNREPVNNQPDTGTNRKIITLMRKVPNKISKEKTKKCVGAQCWRAGGRA